MRSDSKNISGLIAAAGNSSRMGSDKAFLNINGEYFIQNLIKKLSSICKEVIVVAGENYHNIETYLKEDGYSFQVDVKLIKNENYQAGMFSSLQKGLSKINNADWVLYHFIDQQSLPIDFYEDLILQTDEKFEWIQPSFEGRKGHPILLSNKIFNRIISAEDFTNLRDLSASEKFIKYIWQCSYPAIFEDIDTPEEYNAMKRIIAAGE